RADPAGARMVRKGGLEPPRAAPPAPKAGASTNSATFAYAARRVGERSGVQFGIAVRRPRAMLRRVRGIAPKGCRPGPRAESASISDRGYARQIERRATSRATHSR